MNLLVYKDKGVDPFMFFCLLEQLEAVRTPYLLVSAEELRDGDAFRNAGTLVMPGGQARFYHERLQGSGNANIRRFVENGGRYLGLCGGAYYACSEVRWEGVSPSPRTVSHELGFFKGAARGPSPPSFFVPAFENVRGQEHLFATEIAYQEKKAAVVYNLGPVFEGEVSGACRVLAEYRTREGGTTPAVLQIAVGKGRAVLCSPHPEASGAALGRIEPRFKNAPTALAAAFSLPEVEEARAAFWQHLCRQSGLARLARPVRSLGNFRDLSPTR